MAEDDKKEPPPVDPNDRQKRSIRESDRKFTKADKPKPKPDKEK